MGSVLRNIIKEKIKSGQHTVNKPDPSNFSSRRSWMEECVPQLIDEGNDQDQAVAICSNMWENRNTGEETLEIYYD